MNFSKFGVIFGVKTDRPCYTKKFDTTTIKLIVDISKLAQFTVKLWIETFRFDRLKIIFKSADYLQNRFRF